MAHGRGGSAQQRDNQRHFSPSERAHTRNYGVADSFGEVFGVNNLWFGDGDRTKYIWTAPLLHERSQVISTIQNPVEYKGPEGLDGQVLVGVRGHTYVGLTELVEAGQIARTDVGSMEAALLFVAAQRADFAILPQHAVDSYLEKHELHSAVHIAEKPHAAYDRMVLITPSLVEQHPDVAQLVGDVLASSEWQDLLTRYDIAHPAK